MKKIIILTVSIITILGIFALVAVYGNELPSGEAIVEKITAFINVIRYDFDKLEAVPDKAEIKPETENENVSELENESMLFTPLHAEAGWLYELSGGEPVKVTVGTLVSGEGNFTERYIDIAGLNGSVRYLSNSYAKEAYGSKSLFWSAKRQDGNSIVKDFSGEINSVVLFELDDGTKYLYGYTETEEDHVFWSLDIPDSNCFIYSK